MVTSPNIVQSPSVNYIWQSGFPQFAFKDGALMSRILSLAALHRAYLDPANRDTAMMVAGRHHSQAITGLMESLQQSNDPDHDNCIFANAVLTFFYAFISFGPLYNDDKGANAAFNTSRVLGASWIPLIRGLGPVMERTHQQVALGPLSSLLDIERWMELQPDTMDDPDDQHINRIGDIWRKGDLKDSEQAGVYDTTLSALRQCNMWLKQSATWGDTESPQKANYLPGSGPFIWISVAPEAYFKLLRQRQPPAMIIFACFGALIHVLDYHWWMEGCGRSIVEVVDQCLGPYWSNWMEWPRQVVRHETLTSHHG
ncbi:hypothetical protein E8E12_001830 [Didymella heteroderae]|uniref:Sequence-specific DNA binding RNA polymerase II transcription factor n=1 Tax=Didymella heteroderae TaxID=1769908 RepID=A0A9P4WLM4_9PLEO|nr:hypothetical protein E8E12_001830 [Didymella heteroderae]